MFPSLAKATVVCVLCLMVWPTMGLLPLPEPLALLQALVVVLIVPVVLPLTLLRRQGVLTACIAIFFTPLLMMTFAEWDFLGCGVIEARVASSVCREDAGLRQLPSFLAAIVLLIRLAYTGLQLVIQHSFAVLARTIQYWRIS
jgi:hypothetical protein